jgi:hypothetical protein
VTFILIHPTAEYPFKDGWEFVCTVEGCAYRARYYTPAGASVLQLEIIDTGNDTARHTSNSISDIGNIVKTNSMVPWLTPRLRKQIDEILKKKGMF